MADRAGLSVPFLSQVETSFVAPSLTSLFAIARVLETTPERLLAVDLDDGHIVIHRLAAGNTMTYSTATRHRWHHLGAETTRFVHVSAPG